MKFIKFILLLFPILLFQCTPSYSDYSESNKETVRQLSEKPSLVKEPGKCYAKALISDQYQVDSIDYILYTGVQEYEENEVQIEDVTVVIRPATTKWVKRQADRNCLSADPNDCLVWCLVEIPEETMEYTTLVDTSLSKNFEVRQYKTRNMVRKGGFTEWREVLCNYQVTTDVVEQIQNQLLSLGYDPGPSDTVMGTRIKAALTKYQKSNSLPVGQLDMETMDMLGISFD